MLYQKILVALDFSSQTPAVLDRAEAIAIAENSQLMLLHCLDWDEEENSYWVGMGTGTLADPNTYTDWYKLRQENLQQELQKTQKLLETYCEKLTAKGISVERDCRVGSPSFWICDRAKNWGADLIIVGRRGYRGLSELLIGSISNYVIHHAPCSVLVVQENRTSE
jgi:nucleotide-binding universal stress UspA family protein